MRRTTTCLAVTLLIFVSNSHAAELIQNGVKAQVCGGFAGLRCGDKEWCDFPTGSACGIGDRFGVCRARPEVCPRIVYPGVRLRRKDVWKFVQGSRAGREHRSRGRVPRRLE